MPSVVQFSRRAGSFSRVHCVAWALLMLSGCMDAPGNCPYNGVVNEAPSAGCFSVSHDGLLLVQGFNGQVSLPGGSGKPGEAAQCTAFRETWEETGLRLQPRELLGVFDTGFHLFRCERGGISQQIEPPMRLEVWAAFYLPPEEFDQYEWRFPSQREILHALLAEKDRRP